MCGIFWENFEALGLVLELWRRLLLAPAGSGSEVRARWDFWEELNYGWMREYVWPYDDIFGVVLVSRERKLRIGG